MFLTKYFEGKRKTSDYCRKGISKRKRMIDFKSQDIYNQPYLRRVARYRDGNIAMRISPTKRFIFTPQKSLK